MGKELDGALSQVILNSHGKELTVGKDHDHECNIKS